MTETRPDPGAAVFTDAELGAALDPGERVIWQGRPVPRRGRDAGRWFWLIFAAIFGGVGTVFLAIALAATQLRLVFLPVGAVFLAIAAVSLILPRWFEARRVAALRYLLTDRRALVAAGERLRAWPITPHLIRDMRLGSPGSLVFDRETTAMTINDEVVLRDVGFIDIAEAEEIAQIIRRLQARPIPTDERAPA